MVCKKCGKETREGDTLCTNCGKSISESVKSKKKLIINIIMIIALVTIIGTVIIKSLNDSTNDISDNENNKEQQIEDEEIDIKLYDANNKPLDITLDNTVEKGAVYNFTIDDFKLAVETVCKQNNIEYEENSDNKENYYGITFEYNDSLIGEASLTLESNKVVSLGVSWSTSLANNSISYLESKIFTGIIQKLFEEEYATEIIEAKEEMSYSEFRYVNNTLFTKLDLTTLMLLQMKDEENIEELMEEWESNREKINLDLSIFIIAPSTEEVYEEVRIEFYEMKDLLMFTENKAETIFKDENSMKYIKFTSENEFEMLFNEDATSIHIDTGTYTKKGNEVVLNVKCDELYEEEAEGVESYKMSLKILDENSLELTDNNITYIFKRTMISSNEDINGNLEENTSTKVETNINNNVSNISKPEEPKKKWTYTQIALTGCVIEEFDLETGKTSYKHKCESCGALQAGGTTRYLKGSGIFNGGFLCYKCNTVQKVQIETIAKYD